MAQDLSIELDAHQFDSVEMNDYLSKNLTPFTIHESDYVSDSASVQSRNHDLSNVLEFSIHERAQSPTNSEPDWEGTIDMEDSSRGDYDDSLKYYNACKYFGVVPVSYFVRNLSLSRIDLKHHGLGPKGAKAICISLTSNSHVNFLNISDNGIGPSGAIAVADMLRENCFITEIDLSSNKLGNTGAIAIFHVLLENSTVTRCNLSNNDLENKCAEYISDLLKSNFALTFIDLSHNQLDEVAGVLIGNAIGENEVLKSLNLSWNALTEKGAFAIAQGLKNNTMLRSVDLSFNGLGNDAVSLMADALRSNSTLTHLSLNNNNISYAGTLTISRALEYNDTLQYLDLSCNPFESSGAINILNSIMKSSNTALQFLNFKDIQVCLPMKEVMSDIFEMLPHLKINHGSLLFSAKPKKISQTPIMKLSAYLSSNKIQLLDLFKRFDVDNAGIVQTKDIHKTLNAMLTPLTTVEISDIIKSMDGSLAGTIEYFTFLKTLETHEI